eukprot:8631626-Pyramimonas_sp.AAC.1
MWMDGGRMLNRWCHLLATPAPPLSVRNPLLVMPCATLCILTHSGSWPRGHSMAAMALTAAFA